MDHLVKYLSSDVMSCNDLDNLKAAIVAAIYVQVKPTLSEVASWLCQNRDLVNVRTADINTKTIGYMLLCLQRYGYVKRVVLYDEDVFVIDPRHISRVADMIVASDFRKLDTTPVIDVVNNVVSQVMASGEQEADDSLLNQSVFYAPPRPPTPSQSVVLEPAADVAPVETQPPAAKPWCVVM